MLLIRSMESSALTFIWMHLPTSLLIISSIVGSSPSIGKVAENSIHWTGFSDSLSCLQSFNFHRCSKFSCWKKTSASSTTTCFKLFKFKGFRPDSIGPKDPCTVITTIAGFLFLEQKFDKVIPVFKTSFS